MNKKPLVVGITGGIGSGKSTCSKVFALLDIPIYDSDSKAKLLYNTDPTLRDGVVELFGAAVYKDEKLNRKVLAKAVFGFPEKMKQLEQLVHPRVHQDRAEWLTKQTAPYVLIEAAILIESGGYKNCDKVIHVSASREERIMRVLHRDKTLRKEVEKRLDQQLSDLERMKYANFEIVNEGEALVIPQILSIDRSLRSAYT